MSGDVDGAFLGHSYMWFVELHSFCGFIKILCYEE